MRRYPEDAVWEEVTFLAYHLHWSLEDLLNLEHRQRARLIGLVAGVDARQREAMSHG